MTLGDFTVVGLTETSITLQPVPVVVDPTVTAATITPSPRAGGYQQTIPATVEQTRALSISQVITLSLTPKA